MQATYLDELHNGDERINVLNENELRIWSLRLGITEQQLRNAIFIEGPLLKEVKNYLRRHGLISRP